MKKKKLILLSSKIQEVLGLTKLEIYPESSHCKGSKIPSCVVRKGHLSVADLKKLYYTALSQEVCPS